MSTTMRPKRSPGLRRGSGGGDEHEQEYDLLTAALIGATIGAGLTFLMSRATTRRTVAPVMARAVRQARQASREASAMGRRGAKWAAERGEELWDAVPRKEMRQQIDAHLGRARKSIDRFVDRELRDLRRAIRRQRKKVGL